MKRVIVALTLALLTMSCKENYESHRSYRSSATPANQTSQPSNQNSTIPGSSASDPDPGLGTISSSLDTMLFTFVVDLLDPNSDPLSNLNANGGSSLNAEQILAKVKELLAQLNGNDAELQAMISTLLGNVSGIANAGDFDQDQLKNFAHNRIESVITKLPAMIQKLCFDEPISSLKSRCDLLMERFDANKDGHLDATEIKTAKLAGTQSLIDQKPKFLDRLSSGFCAISGSQCESEKVSSIKTKLSSGLDEVLTNIKAKLSAEGSVSSDTKVGPKT
jgi:hypothetical protein